jgi:hypothetical protein
LTGIAGSEASFVPNTVKKDSVMNQTTHEPLHLSGEEAMLLSELLESARARLLIEIRHTDHRAFRDELRHRLTGLERLIEKLNPTVHCGSE